MQAISEQKSKRMTAAVVVAGLFAIIAGGWAHGKMTQRWGPPSDLVKAATALQSFPAEFAEWRLQDSTPMDQQVVETLDCAGYINRTYRNLGTSEVVRIAVLVGPPGPTAVHTPEICYSSRTYKIEEAAKKQPIFSGKSEHAFWKVQFRSEKPGGGTLWVHYAWTVDGAWQASDAPRYAFGGAPYLYKLQVAGEPLIAGKEGSNDPCQTFLNDLMQSGWNLQDHAS